jgi:glycosyltransferase involved in cell wall biosynthesis
MTPLITIVLPVFNGSNFLAEAVDSLLSQSLKDFELIISDNASTDDTPSICERFARSDPRVKLFRFEKNVGAARNFNHAFAAVRSKYFKWAAHDDICRPAFLEACVDVLERDRSIVLCHTGTKAITEAGEELGRLAILPDMKEDDPARRFASMITFPHLCAEVFGVFRTEVLAKTPLVAPYVGSDRVLLAEIAIRGKIGLVLRGLFLNRRHDENSILQYPDESARLAWFDPALGTQRSYPVSRLTAEYLKSIERTDISEAQKDDCRGVLKKWMQKGLYIDGQPVGQLLRREQSDWGRVGPDERCPCQSGLSHADCHGGPIFALHPAETPTRS